MKLIVTPQNKKQEKAIKDFLETKAIDFTVAEEDAAMYKTASHAVPEWQKKFVRKSIKKYKVHPELLISEKDAWAIIDADK